MKIRVDSARCQGHALCAMIAPESFELDEVDGHSRAIHEVVPAHLQEQVREAIRSCPEQAILVEDDDRAVQHNGAAQ